MLWLTTITRRTTRTLTFSIDFDFYEFDRNALVQMQICFCHLSFTMHVKVQSIAAARTFSFSNSFIIFLFLFFLCKSLTKCSSISVHCMCCDVWFVCIASWLMHEMPSTGVARVISVQIQSQPMLFQVRWVFYAPWIHWFESTLSLCVCVCVSVRVGVCV